MRVWVSAVASLVALTACVLSGGQRVEPIPGAAGVVITSPQALNADRRANG